MFDKRTPVRQVRSAQARDRRNAPRPVRDRVAARRGRDWGGVPGTRYAARQGNPSQGPSRIFFAGCRSAAAVRAGGARGVGTQPSEHPDDLRHRDARRRSVSRLGVGPSLTPRAKSSGSKRLSARPAHFGHVSPPGTSRRHGPRQSTDDRSVPLFACPRPGQGALDTRRPRGPRP